MARYILFLSLLLTFVCSADLGAGQNAEKEVHFIIQIPVELFSKDATISVRIKGPKQIERNRNNERCNSIYNMITRKTETTCPEGVEYLEITPEEFEFPIKTINEYIDVRSETIKVGDEYILAVYGKAADECNTTRASTRGKAQEETITLPIGSRRTGEGLEWGTTLMGC